MKLFPILLILLGALHGVAGASMVPGLLTAVSGGLLAVMTLLDSRGPHGSAGGLPRPAWRRWQYRSSRGSRSFRSQISMR